MSYKQIEASREARLWLGQIIIPAITTVMIVSPEAREWATTKVRNTVNRIKSKFSK